jgi:hypothetical protein
MQKIRVMLGLDVTTRTRLEYLRKVIYEYEKISEVRKALAQRTNINLH